MLVSSRVRDADLSPYACVVHQNLTGGVDGGLHMTDVTNASRTMLMNIESLKWDSYLCHFFGVPERVLPEIRTSSEIYGYMTSGSLSGIPIAGVGCHSFLFGNVLSLHSFSIITRVSLGTFLVSFEILQISIDSQTYFHEFLSVPTGLDFELNVRNFFTFNSAFLIDSLDNIII